MVFLPEGCHAPETYLSIYPVSISLKGVNEKNSLDKGTFEVIFS